MIDKNHNEYLKAKSLYNIEWLDEKWFTEITNDNNDVETSLLNEQFNSNNLNFYKIQKTSNSNEEIKISKKDLESLQNLSNFKKFLDKYIKRNDAFFWTNVGLTAATWALAASYAACWRFVSAAMTTVQASFMTVASVKTKREIDELKKERDKLEKLVHQEELNFLINVTSEILSNNLQNLGKDISKTIWETIKLKYKGAIKYLYLKKIIHTDNFIKLVKDLFGISGLSRMEKFSFALSSSIYMLEKTNKKLFKTLTLFHSRGWITKYVNPAIDLALTIATSILDVISSMQNYRDQKIFEKLIDSL
ncbi:hypothetical protein NX779_02050 [Mycoplasma cottewii]|uniref:Uncharacterized protein n=1 Tax=Mycoplasma cottewii TaxID=51364 RepID=A0ABY5TYD5_9MOLU|nr:hypothetical protein [Mycoplasma cottewii]UWD35399.1 hypothetical protein NX779_02050 [Mycoplasma cottewii]